MSAGEGVISYEDFLAEVTERKRRLWVQILAREPSGRAPGRRPRDPLKEALLTRLDAERLARLERDGSALSPERSTSGR